MLGSTTGAVLGKQSETEIVLMQARLNRHTGIYGIVGTEKLGKQKQHKMLAELC